ncbi:MAG: SpoIIE family protein phosphatase [Dehalococcoidia bacterium]|nr:SpoIIE family protein phosphatase [Dehalococcoidia bacterium]
MTLQKKYKILVVDDEPDLEPLLLQRMRRAIRAGRYEFVFAGNGLEALQRLDQDEEIDMVLSDINMPQMDGLTLLEQIPDVNPNIRSVIISAYGDMKNIRTAMNRGAFDFVTKPIDFKDLQVTIDRTLIHVEELKEALMARDKLVTLQNELDVASNIQQSILPTELPRELDYQMFGSMKSARNVGGDFFDVVRLPDRRVGLAIADVSDKGVPAALFMMSTRTLLKGAAIGAINPGDVMDTVNQLLCEDNEAAMFVTLLYAVYDPETGRLTYANGGHNPPLIIHQDNTSTLLPSTEGLALGLLPDYEYQQKTVTVEPGETLVLYTDGVTEAMNANEEEFGVERLQDIFTESYPREAHAITQLIFDAVDEFAGDTPQSDDVTCLTLCRG